MDTLDKLVAVFESPLLDLLLKGSLIYLGVLWFAMIVWVARDVINRSNNILFQVAVILANIVLPVFGLILYLIVRPSKTLLEKYYEELEYTFLSDHAHDEEKCPRCEETLNNEFLYCPGCAERVRNSCWNCKHVYHSRYVVCPYCGKKEKKKGIRDIKKKKEEEVKEKAKSSS